MTKRQGRVTKQNTDPTNKHPYLTMAGNEQFTDGIVVLGTAKLHS